MKREVPIALSNRHIHLSQEDIEALFGPGHQLTVFKDLSQPGQYACEEKVDIVGPKGALKGVRVLGPARKQTQAEVSFADGFVLGVKPPVRDSGDLAGSPGAKIIGPAGEVEIKEGIIAAARHIHMHTSDAARFGVCDKQKVNVVVGGERAITFQNVLVRVHDTYALEMHVDVEEGNACGAKNGQVVEIEL